MPDAKPHDAIAAAINLAPHIRAVREELETTRRVPPSLVQAINDAGLFRPYLPRAMGGSELPPLTVYRVIEEISNGRWLGRLVYDDCLWRVALERLAASRRRAGPVWATA